METKEKKEGKGLKMTGLANSSLALPLYPPHHHTLAEPAMFWCLPSTLGLLCFPFFLLYTSSPLALTLHPYGLHFYVVTFLASLHWRKWYQGREAIH
ncbi:uncharacterized protein B0T23DRAFT_378275 [Neurospora hispaniola]|uniref:Uncharacterized protein n=1 Tax=Neurospora hispaniola TaxID=588809 RepID=A0AAJ0IAR6_9PEZI|nr:hypothetical protein B0T23DRAFT_378275 [Neurospora hispaniola]